MNEHSTVFCIRAARCGGPCGGAGTGTKCGRWNPTSEQVKVLTELFKSGLRTPTTEQIQKISSQLSSYGKIESKNVFYWFQNHKARERQKRRRVLVDDGNDRRQIYGVTKYTSTKHFCEPIPSERVIETLQLFPLNSFCDSEKEKIKRLTENCKENALLACSDIVKEMDPPTLDLQLSFIYNISNGL